MLSLSILRHVEDQVLESKSHACKPLNSSGLGLRPQSHHANAKISFFLECWGQAGHRSLQESPQSRGSGIGSIRTLVLL